MVGVAVELSPELMALIEPLCLPAIHLVGSSVEGASYLAGAPHLPADVPWPRHNETALLFIGQIHLPDVPKIDSALKLPSDGLLSIFCHPGIGHWGSEPEDKGTWRIFHFDVPIESLGVADFPDDLPEYFRYDKKFVEFVPFVSLPNLETKDVGRPLMRALGEENLEAYGELQWAPYGEQPMHQIFGHPVPVQGDWMAAECELIRIAAPKTDDRFLLEGNSPEFNEGVKEWKLLFQFDSDEETGFMFFDMGQLYFWIREQDLAAQNFDDTWMILQSG
jgi:hypothetical protein